MTPKRVFTVPDSFWAEKAADDPIKLDPERMAQASRDLASLSAKQIACPHRWRFVRRKQVRGKWRFEYCCQCGTHLDRDERL